MNRRTTVLAAAALLLAAPAPTEAQLSFGAHVARANDVFGGANGVGLSAMVGVPLLPIGALAAGEYFFPDCGADEGCGYAGGSASLKLRLPLPMVSPYATGGLVWRRYTPRDGVASESHSGVGAGLGVDLNTLVLKFYAEARYEWVDPDDQLMIRVGVLF